MASIFNTENSTNEASDSKPRAIVAGLLSAKGSGTSNSEEAFEHSMNEMVSLVEACDIEVACIVTQTLVHPDNATYMGSGKIEEIAGLLEEYEAEYLIFEDNLSPAQMKNISKLVERQVWDRTNLILEIFSRRAQTREARLQVESAYLQYMLPRLSGMWQHLGRQGGGSGARSNKGIGETQLELDRRHISQRIAELGRELDNISRTRDVQRSGRKKGYLKTVSLVGYTNAGKSSLMNYLLENTKSADKSEEKKVFEKDMLFATLDTSIRRISRADKPDFLLSDTVGFIENLPHGLVKAFRSTLEEVKYADLLLIVLDVSDPYHNEHRIVTENTLKDLGADGIPRIYVYNKCDLVDITPKNADDRVYISAKSGKGIEELFNVIDERLNEGIVRIEKVIPYDKGALLNLLHERATILTKEYEEEGIRIVADCPKEIAGKFM